MLTACPFTAAGGLEASLTSKHSVVLVPFGTVTDVRPLYPVVPHAAALVADLALTVRYVAKLPPPALVSTGVPEVTLMLNWPPASELFVAVTLA